MMKKRLKRTNFINFIEGGSLRDDLADNELWHEFATKITPLAHRNRCPEINASDYSCVREALNINLKRNVEVSKSQINRNYLAHRAFPINDVVEPDFKSTRKIRRGKVQIQARLDLHGMSQKEAHKSLLIFLEETYVSSKKLVLVITGKGQAQDGKLGVLRRVVPKWMNELPMKKWIRGHGYAAPSDGGEGALYVLLRR